jgi:hypothetical protein
VTYLVDANVLSEPTKPVPSMIAATALQHDLTVAMRNNRDFNKLGVKILTPSRDHANPRFISLPSTFVVSSHEANTKRRMSRPSTKEQ